MDNKFKRLIVSHEMNEFLQKFFSQIKSILQDQLVGMYIGGSIANNCFNDETSDIDCYIITKDILTKNIIQAIEKMHHQLFTSNHPYAKKIEASYIPHEDLVNFHPSNTRPYFNEGNFYLAHYGSNYEIELFILRNNAVKIEGPEINELIPEITSANLKLAIQKNLEEYWKLNLNNISKFKRSEYQVFAILTMCRSLYSLETGNIASKVEAAKWAINYSSPWKNLIERALAWKPNHEFNQLEEAQQFVNYVISKYHGNKV